jgi:hypothetical protein
MSKRFTAVNALLISVLRNKNNGYAKIKFQLTAKITKALEWPEMPEGTAEWIPDVDELKASLIELTPNNDELRAKSVSVDCLTIGDFVVQRKAKKDGPNAVKGEKKITEVHCKVTFSDPCGCAKLEQYLQSAARSEMLVCYTPQPVQGELPGTRVELSDGTNNGAQMTIDEGGEPRQSPEAAAAVAEIPDGPAPTHAEKLAARKLETERKRKMREDATGPVQ